MSTDRVDSSSSGSQGDLQTYHPEKSERSNPTDGGGKQTDAHPGKPTGDDHPGGPNSRDGAGLSRHTHEEQGTRADKLPAATQPAGQAAAGSQPGDKPQPSDSTGKGDSITKAVAGQDSPLRPDLSKANEIGGKIVKAVESVAEGRLQAGAAAMPNAENKVQEAKGAAAKIVSGVENKLQEVKSAVAASDAATKIREFQGSPTGKVVDGILRADHALGQEGRKLVAEKALGPVGEMAVHVVEGFQSTSKLEAQIKADKNLTDNERAMKAVDGLVQMVPGAQVAENLMKAENAFKAGNTPEGVNQTVQGVAHAILEVGKIVLLHQAAGGAMAAGATAETGMTKAGTEAGVVKAVGATAETGVTKAGTESGATKAGTETGVTKAVGATAETGANKATETTAKPPGAPDVYTVETIPSRAAKPAPAEGRSRNTSAADRANLAAKQQRYNPEQPKERFQVDHVRPFSQTPPGADQKIRLRDAHRNMSEGGGQTRQENQTRREQPDHRDPTSPNYTRPVEKRGGKPPGPAES